MRNRKPDQLLQPAQSYAAKMVETKLREAAKKEREDGANRYKAPIQELARLKDEIKMIHGSLKGFDMGKWRDEKNQKEEDFENDLKKKLGALDEYARRKEVENLGCQFPDEND
jgi:hypothetical protein